MGWSAGGADHPEMTRAGLGRRLAERYRADKSSRDPQVCGIWSRSTSILSPVRGTFLRRSRNMPRSGSTYYSLGQPSCPPRRRGNIWGRSRAEASGERLTAVARLLSVTRRPRTHALTRIRVGHLQPVRGIRGRLSASSLVRGERCGARLKLSAGVPAFLVESGYASFRSSPSGSFGHGLQGLRSLPVAGTRKGDQA